MNLSTSIETIRSWTNEEGYDDTLITSFIRMAEQDLSTKLRCGDMVQIDVATITENRVPLPQDWQEADFIRLVDGGVLDYVGRKEFYEQPNAGKYTITGNFLVVGGEIDPINGTAVELSYFGSIPEVTESGSTFLTSKYHRLFVFSTLVMASAYGIEDDRAMGFDASAVALVEQINNSYSAAKSSGSRIKRTRTRSFG